MKKSLGLALAASLALSFGGAANVAHADNVGPTTFETFNLGSVNGQNGWSSTGAFDQGVVPTTRYPSFGGQALRISNSVVSGSFGDQPMSPAIAEPAGESTPQKHFDSTFQIGSMSDAEQPGLMLSVSPDDGNGARMSYLRFEDQPTGVKVIFAEAKDAGPVGAVADFPETTIATLNRTNAHTIRFSIDFVAGASNDVAKIYIDGVLKHTGTTWENYFRFDPEAAAGGNVVSPVSKLLFRVGGGAIPAAPATNGEGFLIDNVNLTSSTNPTAPGAPTAVTAKAGDKTATVSWTAPANNGGSAITGYTVTSTSGAKTATTKGATTATVTGLTNGTAYTFTVKATNKEGTSDPSAKSNAVTPQLAVTRLSDFNKDGFTDLVARDATGKLWLYPGNGAGGFLSRRLMGIGWNGMTAIVTPGDVTGDRNADLLAKDSLGHLWLYPGNGASGLSARRQIGSGWQSYTVINAANMNGTGGPDLLARDSAGKLWLYPLSGNAVFGTRSVIGAGWNGYTIQGSGDVSGDGKADILARDTTGKLWLYPGNGAGGLSARRQIGTGWQGMTAMVTPGNWDGKGANDILAPDTTGKLWLYPSNYAGAFAQRTLVGSGWQFTFIG